MREERSPFFSLFGLVMYSMTFSTNLHPLPNPTGLLRMGYRRFAQGFPSAQCMNEVGCSASTLTWEERPPTQYPSIPYDIQYRLDFFLPFSPLVSW